MARKSRQFLAEAVRRMKRRVANEKRELTKSKKVLAHLSKTLQKCGKKNICSVPGKEFHIATGFPGRD
jgi:hypothetical protein